MSFGIGIVIGAVGMLLLQVGALGVFALKEIIKGSRKGMKYIETTETIDTGAEGVCVSSLSES